MHRGMTDQIHPMTAKSSQHLLCLGTEHNLHLGLLTGEGRPRAPKAAMRVDGEPYSLTSTALVRQCLLYPTTAREDEKV